MQLAARCNVYSTSLGQDDVARLLTELILEKSGFSRNKEIYVWGDNWERYSIESLKEDIRIVLKNKWRPSMVSYIVDSVLHNTKQEINEYEGRIAFENGYFDIEKGEFTYDAHFVKNNRILNFQSFIYDPKATCPNFLKALHEMFPESHLGLLKRKSLIQYFAYCFCPVNYQKCLVLFGPGANGKSTLLDVHKLFFKNHSEIELHELDDQNAVVSLEGVSMIYSHEGVFNYRAMSNFKKIVEGKKVLVNRKYIDKYWIEIKCKAMIATNNFLRLEKLDNALLRRMVVIDMNADFRGREDFGLMKQLENEMAGIFNLVISEAKELINSQGSFAYNRPDDIQLNQDLLILKSYIQDIFKRTPGQEMQFAEFYDGYSQYCESSRIKPIGKSKVSCLLNEFDFGVKSYRGAGNRVMVRISL